MKRILKDLLLVLAAAAVEYAVMLLIRYAVEGWS